MSASKIFLEENGQAVIEVSEQLAVVLIAKGEREAKVRGEQRRRRLVIKKDEWCASRVTHTGFDVDVRLTRGRTIVEDAKVCGPDSSIDVVKYLDAPDIPARPIQFNVVRLQDLREVPSQGLLNLRYKPMTYETRLLRSFLLSNKQDLDVVEAPTVHLSQFLQA